MKPPTESQKVFEAYAIIDASYFLMQKVMEEWDSKKAKSPLDKMVDVNTGYSETLFKQYSVQVVELLDVMIANKKIVEADYSADEALREKLLNTLVQSIS